MYRKRISIWIPIILFTGIFLVLVSNLFYMQVLNGEKYLTISENNYVRISKIKPMRGSIYDRKYRPVALNRTSDNLYFRLSEINEKGKLAQFISDNFAIDSLAVRQIMQKNRFRKYNDIALKKGLDRAKLVEIAENMYKYPSLRIISEYTRHYEYPNHLTGHVGGLNESEYENLKDEGYTLSSNIGKSGLEKQYEEMLRGESGYRLIQVDATGKDLEFLKHNLYQPAKKGLDLILSVDNDLQTYIRSIFPEDKLGAVIVMDVRTGGILSYVSMPEFDPNIFSGEISQGVWNELINDPAQPMLDRVSNGTYPPGSIFKPITASMGLETGVITPSTKMTFCNGGKQIGTRYFKCWKEQGHGRLAVSEAIKLSCDVFFYDLSMLLDLDEMKNFTKANFLTVKTGIDLPIERNGFFPDEAWYRKNYGRYTGIIGPKVNLSIGQGEILVTVLELCAYYSALANDGLWLQPHFLEGYIDKDRVKVSDYETRRLPLATENLELLQHALDRTINEAHGTGSAAKVKGVTVYGKTGSAENHMGKSTHAWFAGYAEWEEPEIAFIVFVQNAGHGGSIAAPIGGKIVKFYDKLRTGNPEEYLKFLPAKTEQVN